MRTALVALICLGISGSACKKGEGAPDAGPSAAVRPASGARDESGHLKPKTPRPPDNPADLPPAAADEPSWDLDKADPARDYVERYVRATLRYGEATRCVEVRTAGQSGAKALVEITKPESCTGPVARDTFLVDVSGDRLEAKGGASLKKWPDGSDPGGPTGAPAEIDPPGALRDALFGLQLTPIRYQGYGRGSYVLVTLAGWHAPLTPGAPPDAMREAAAKACAANNGLPLAFVAGIDRATVLRVRCGAAPSARWDRG